MPHIEISRLCDAPTAAADAAMTTLLSAADAGSAFFQSSRKYLMPWSATPLWRLLCNNVIIEKKPERADGDRRRPNSKEVKCMMKRHRPALEAPRRGQMVRSQVSPRRIFRHHRNGEAAASSPTS